MPQNIRAAQIIRRLAFEEWGGTETVVWNTACHLPDYGVRPEILCTKACSACPEFPEIRNQLEIRRFSYFYPNFPLNRQRRLALDKKGGNPVALRLERYLRQQDFDLYHMHSAGRLGLLVREVARQKQRPYVVSFHGGFCDVPTAEIQEMMRPLHHTFPYGKFIDYWKHWRGDFVSEASGLICVGENELQLLQQRYPEKKIIYLPNGIDLKTYRTPAKGNLREQLHLPEKRKILLCISRIDYQKNQKRLLQVLKQLLLQQQDVQLLLIGPVTAPDYYRELQNEAQQEHLSDRLTVIEGAQPGSDFLRSAYQQSTVFMLPSRHEPFGIVALEAWASGIPVVGAQVGGLQYLLKNGQNAFSMASDDTEAYVNAWNALQDPATRETMIANAQHSVEAYAWENITARLAAFYQEVVQAHHR